MRIKSIVVEFEPDLESIVERNHATRAGFSDGKWEANGPMFARFYSSLHKVWQLLRDSKDEQAGR